MTRVAVIGHVEWVEFLTLDALPAAGQVVHAHDSFTRAAGGGGVAEVVLAELGAQVDFFCALGDDDTGRAAAAQLEQRGVTPRIAWRRKQPTRRALGLLIEGGDRAVVTIGHRLEPDGEDGLPWERLAAADGVFVTAGDAPALDRARAAQVVVATPRAREAFADPAGPRVDALVFSAGDHDEAAWAGELAPRSRLLVATEGAVGGRWWGESEGRWEAVAPDGPIRDSFGCGDSFAAALTFGLAQGLSVAQAAALGARCGARALTRSGAP